jgi:hypothetical protein
MDRTVASARSFLAGLFSSEKKDNKIQANGPFEIEVHHFPDEDMVNIFESFSIKIEKFFFCSVSKSSCLSNSKKLSNSNRSLFLIG